MTTATCRRCDAPDATAAWAAWWEESDLPIVIPPDAAAPWCPRCMTPTEETAFLVGVHSVAPLLAERYADVSRRIDDRLDAVLTAGSVR